MAQSETELKTTSMRLIFVMTVLSLAGCQSSPVFYHRSPLRHVVVIDHQEISVLPHGDDRWEAYGGNPGKGPTATGSVTDRQIKAIEVVSLCKVVKFGYEPDQEKDKLLLQATVNCSLKN
jgi:hypothetical protein